MTIERRIGVAFHENRLTFATGAFRDAGQDVTGSIAKASQQ